MILLLPLHRIWKIGRVIDRAGLEIRYTPFGYRGFESLIFRKIINKPIGHYLEDLDNKKSLQSYTLQRFLFLPTYVFTLRLVWRTLFAGVLTPFTKFSFKRKLLGMKCRAQHFTHF